MMVTAIPINSPVTTNSSTGSSNRVQNQPAALSSALLCNNILTQNKTTAAKGIEEGEDDKVGEEDEEEIL